jgi:hypothetical protein
VTSVIRRLLPIRNSLHSTSTLSDVIPKAPKRRQAILRKARQNTGACIPLGEFPIPQLVAGIPWRFAQHIKRPVVPEAEFAPLVLSYISRQ